MMTREAHTSWDARRYFATFVRWLWLLALCTVIGAGSAFIITKMQPPIYRATAVLVVDQRNVPDPIPDASNQLATTYANLIMQPIVLQKAASQVGHISATELAKRMQAYSESNTALIYLSVDDTDPARAAMVANAVVSASITALNQLGLADKYPVVVFQHAIPPTAPDHPNPIWNGAIGGALGFALAAVLIHLLDLLDNRNRMSTRGEELAELASQGGREMAGGHQMPVVASDVLNQVGQQNEHKKH